MQVRDARAEILGAVPLDDLPEDEPIRAHHEGQLQNEEDRALQAALARGRRLDSSFLEPLPLEIVCRRRDGARRLLGGIAHDVLTRARPSPGRARRLSVAEPPKPVNFSTAFLPHRSRVDARSAAQPRHAGSQPDV